MILVVDNYDSFVHNLARYLGELGEERRVVRNDELSVDAVIALHPSAIILSPGPRGPEQAGISLPLACRAPLEGVPVLGVCLGHQAIAVAFGGVMRPALRPTHGRSALITHDGSALFEGIESPFEAGLYHSLAVELDAGGALEVAARDAMGEVMALRHRTLPAWGVQFHPESILTPCGHRLLANFLGLAARARAPGFHSPPEPSSRAD